MLEVKDQELWHTEQCIPCGLAPGVSAQLAGLESEVESWVSGSFYSALGNGPGHWCQNTSGTCILKEPLKGRG